MQPEKAGCHSTVPSLATDKVDRREISALRTCQSNTRACFPLPLHKRVMGVIRGEECERGRWKGRETDIEWPGNKRIEADEMEEGQSRREVDRGGICDAVKRSENETIEEVGGKECGRLVVRQPSHPSETTLLTAAAC